MRVVCEILELKLNFLQGLEWQREKAAVTSLRGLEKYMWKQSKVKAWMDLRFI